MKGYNTQIHHNTFLRWPFFTISYFVMVYGLLSIYDFFFSLSSKDRFLSDMSLNARVYGQDHLLKIFFIISYFVIVYYSVWSFAWCVIDTYNLEKILIKVVIQFWNKFLLKTIKQISRGGPSFDMSIDAFKGWAS